MIHSFLGHLLNGNAFCVIRQTTGFPCPGCGMTRSWLAVIRGDFSSALFYHPLFLIVPLLAYALLKKKQKLTIFIALLFTGVYIVRVAIALSTGHWNNPYYPVSYLPTNLISTCLEWVINIFSSGGNS